MKKKCCMANAILAFAAFCIMFGDVCFVWGGSAANAKEMSGGIFLSVYYLILLIVATALVHNSYYSVKPLLFGAVFSSACIIIVWLIGLISWPIRKAQGNEFISDNPAAVAVLIVITVLSLLMSVLYLIAALKKDKIQAVQGAAPPKDNIV